MSHYRRPEVRRRPAPGSSGSDDEIPSLPNPCATGDAACEYRVHRGQSMVPTLRHSDMLEIVPCSHADLRTGDIVVAVPPGENEQVVHRVVGRTNNALHTRGDNCLETDPWDLEPENVKGKVIAVCRGRDRRVLYGGWLGVWYVRRLRIAQGLVRVCAPVAAPLYRGITRSGVLRRLLPARLQPRVVEFTSERGTQRRVMMGSREVAWQNAETGAWHVPRPYNLFVDEKALPMEGIESTPSPEMELLLLVCTPPTPPATSERMRLLAESLDWRRMLQLAASHGLTSVFWRHLPDDIRSVMPETRREELRTLCMQLSAEGLAVSQELVRVVRLLESGGAKVVPIKGHALAALANEDPLLRMSWDIDLLVQPDDMQRARALLEHDGYRLALDLGPNAIAAYMRRRGECIFIHPTSGRHIDLETNLVPGYFAFRLNRLSAWETLQTVRVAGADVPSLAMEHLLLLLCIHGSKHVWWRLSWIQDVAGLIRRNPDIDWEAVDRIARETGSRRMLLLGLELARRVTSLELPESPARCIDEDAYVDALALRIVKDLRSGQVSSPSWSRQTRFHLAVRERPIDRLRYSLGLLFTPSYSDWKLLDLPAQFSMFYYAIRPFRLAGSLLTRLIRGRPIEGRAAPTDETRGA